MSKDLTDADEFTSPIHVPENTDLRDDAGGDVELIAQRLANRTRNLKNRIDGVDTTLSDVARKSQLNTFTQAQTINVDDSVADWPLITTTEKPGDDPQVGTPPFTPGTNRWKVILEAPTQDNARAGIYVGQHPDGAAMVNNARWHVPTQKWQQYDNFYPSTAIVGGNGQWRSSYVPAGAAAWADWPVDSGGDFLAGGNITTHGQFLYNPPKEAVDWTIPLSCSSGETFLQTDGSYKVGPDGASWPLKVPDLTELTDIYVIVEQASAAQSYAALVRRDKGNVVFAAFPAFGTVAAVNGPASAGVYVLTINCDGHTTLSASWEYAIIFKRGHADDKIARIALGTFVNVGPRNLG